MGVKLASMHVLDSNLVDVSNALARCQFDAAEEAFKLVTKSGDSRSKNGIASITKLFLQGPKTAVFYVVEGDRWRSVFSDYFGPDTVASCAVRWFDHLDNYVLAVGVLDEDYLEAVLVKAGSVVASFVAVASIECYGLQGGVHGAEFFARVFGTDVPRIMAMAESDDAMSVCRELEEIAGIQVEISVAEAAASKRLNTHEIVYDI